MRVLIVEDEVPMAVIAAESNVRKMFSLTAIDQTIPLFDTRQQALLWLQGEGKIG